MYEPVNITYTWNRENVEKLFDTSYSYLFKHSSRRYIGWLFIAILQFGVVAALKKGSIAILLFSSIVLLYWYYGKKLIARRRALNSFERSPFRDKKIEINVSDKGFDIRGTEEPVHWSWEEIDEVIPAGDDILLFKNPNFHYIPSSGFSSLEMKSAFKSLARKHDKLKS